MKHKIRWRASFETEIETETGSNEEIMDAIGNIDPEIAHPTEYVSETFEAELVTNGEEEEE